MQKSPQAKLPTDREEYHRTYLHYKDISRKSNNFTILYETSPFL